VGAGTGLFAKQFCQYSGVKTIYACDTSPVMLNWMHDHLTEDSESIIVPLLSEENTLPLPNALADWVYLFNVYHELDQPEQLLTEIHRVLSPGGK
jgi:ubiquinone/menaquinone biosynthesis C-methylase UbiE